MSKLDEAWDTLRARRDAHAQRLVDVAAAEAQIVEAERGVTEAEAALQGKRDAKADAEERARGTAAAVCDGVDSFDSMLISNEDGWGGLDCGWEELKERRGLHSRRLQEISAVEVEIQEAASLVLLAESVLQDKRAAKLLADQRARAAASAVRDGVDAVRALLPSIVAGLGAYAVPSASEVAAAAEDGA